MNRQGDNRFMIDCQIDIERHKQRGREVESLVD